MIEQHPVYVCDYCKGKMEKPLIVTEDVPNEGCSIIWKSGKSFEVGGQHYCSFSCLVDDIGKHLDSGLPGMKAGKPGKKKGAQ